MASACVVLCCALVCLFYEFVCTVYDKDFGRCSSALLFCFLDCFILPPSPLPPAFSLQLSIVVQTVFEIVRRLDWVLWLVRVTADDALFRYEYYLQHFFVGFVLSGHRLYSFPLGTCTILKKLWIMMQTSNKVCWNETCLMSLPCDSREDTCRRLLLTNKQWTDIKIQLPFLSHSKSWISITKQSFFSFCFLEERKKNVLIVHAGSFFCLSYSKTLLHIQNLIDGSGDYLLCS